MRILYLSIFTLLIICSWFIVTYKKRKRKRDLKRKVLSDSDNNYKENAKNIALSISKSKALYKTLIKKVHPDTFYDDYKNIAEELSTKITNAKKDYNSLIELEKEVEDFIKKVNHGS